MEKDTLRLECLKLAVTKTANQQEILAKAKEYVDFVNETQALPTQSISPPPGTLPK